MLTKTQLGELFSSEVDSWCSALREHGNLYPDLLRGIIEELVPSFKVALEGGFPIDILDVAYRMYQASGCILDHKEITRCILVRLPKPSELSNQGQDTLAQVIDLAEEKYEGLQEALWRNWGYTKAKQRLAPLVPEILVLADLQDAQRYAAPIRDLAMRGVKPLIVTSRRSVTLDANCLRGIAESARTIWVLLPCVTNRAPVSIETLDRAITALGDTPRPRIVFTRLGDDIEAPKASSYPTTTLSLQASPKGPEPSAELRLELVGIANYARRPWPLETEDIEPLVIGTAGESIRLPPGRPRNWTSHMCTDTRGWDESAQWDRYHHVRDGFLDWDLASIGARRWWQALEAKLPPALLLRLAEEVVYRTCCIEDLYSAAMQGHTDNLQGMLDYAEFRKLRQHHHRQVDPT